MAVIATLETTPVSPGNVVPFGTFSAEAADSYHEKCPVRTKRRHVTAEQGQQGDVLWAMRYRDDGSVADLSECFPAGDSDNWPLIEVRFGRPTVGNFNPTTKVLGAVEGQVENAGAGLVRFTLPTELTERAGIYRFQIGLLQNNSLFFADQGLISVEPGLFGDLRQGTSCLSIEEVRMHLRDREIENDLLQAVEFDDAEIVHAIVQPILQWNETPPPIYPCSTETFPFRYNWLNAVVGELLRIAVHHYVRNKMQVESGGLVVDDKNKDAEYLRLSKMYRDEWMAFITQKKVSLNAERAWDSMGSTYSRRGYW